MTMTISTKTNSTALSYVSVITNKTVAHPAGLDGSMSASGSAGLGFDSRWGSKFSFENFQPSG